MADVRAERGEVYFRLTHPLHDTYGVTLSHRAGNFGYVRLIMHGFTLILSAAQAGDVLAQWRKLTHKTGWGSGWKVTRVYFSDHDQVN